MDWFYKKTKVSRDKSCIRIAVKTNTHSKDACTNKKHLKNVGPIRHNEPPHAHSPDAASGTVARRLRIDVHDNDDNDNDNA